MLRIYLLCLYYYDQYLFTYTYIYSYLYMLLLPVTIRISLRSYSHLLYSPQYNSYWLYLYIPIFPHGTKSSICIFFTPYFYFRKTSFWYNPSKAGAVAGPTVV